MSDLSLHQIELASPEARTIMSLLTGVAAVAQIQPLGGLVAAGDLGELALISYSIGSKISLPSDMGQGRFPSLPHSLHSLGGVLFAKRTISVKLFWHLHNASSL